MKIALVHEHLAQNGGAEAVLKAMQAIWPEAPTFTLIHDRRRADPAFAQKDIRTSFLQRMPFGVRRYQWFIGLMPAAIESFRLEDYDVVLSSSSAFAKGVITRPETLHLCYCHSPTRYLWSDSHRYVDELPYSRLTKSLIPFVLHRVRSWDRLAADRVDEFIANSRTVQQRITKYYRRPSTVLYPPVDLARFTLGNGRGGYYLIGGRLVSYKRYDVAIQAFNKLGIPLKIFGAGPDEARLRRLAKRNIEFLGRVADSDLSALYGQAIAFLHPQEEDFGITAVEAMAAGRPVIAYNRGGGAETVVPGVTGQFIDEQSWEVLADTVIRFRPEQFSPSTIRQHAEQFSLPAFQRQLRSFVDSRWSAYQHEIVT